MIYFVINEIIKTSRRRTWPICGDVVLISSELGIAVHDNRRTLISLVFDSVHLKLQTKKGLLTYLWCESILCTPENSATKNVHGH